MIESEIEKVKNSDKNTTLAGHTDSVDIVAITQDGKYLISGSDDNTIKVWNLDEQKEDFTLKGNTSAVKTLAISQDGNYLVSGSYDEFCE